MLWSLTPHEPLRQLSALTGERAQFRIIHFRKEKLGIVRESEHWVLPGRKGLETSEQLRILTERTALQFCIRKL